MSEAVNRVAIFVDCPNLYGSTSELRIKVNFSEVIKQIVEGNNQITVQKMFFDEIDPDETKNNKFLHAMSKLGFEIVVVPKKIYKKSGQIPSKAPKSRTDQMITVHLMTHLNNNDFDTLILFSGDSDYEFVLNEINEHAKDIIIISAKENLAAELIKLGTPILLNDLIGTELVY